ncbi:MAG: RHS repeat-associated core domain-containing protein [Firmicutes bacterium]|nr:RHS repeat-associated core domain-containing protein [Bacillota bacterium]
MQYSYDKFDRTTKEQYNNVTYEYAYDASGQLAKQTSTAGEEYNYEYDSLGRLIRSNEYNDGTFEQRTEHIYDASNRLTKQSWYNAGGVTTMSYAYSTTTGLLSSLNATVQNSSIPVTYTYQGANQLRSKAIGSVMTKAYNFGTSSGYRTALPNFVNYRDPDGNLIYGDYCVYDGNGRIVSIADSGNTSSVRATYGYDEQGQLTSAAVGGTRYAYTYDTAGNLITKTDGGTSHSYTYGNGAWRDLLTAYDGKSITYSGGNPTKYYNGSTFTWTQGRKLATAKVGNTNISYTYDMAGVRSSKTVGSTKYKFTTLSGLVTRQTGGGKTIDFVYDENNQPLAMKYNNTLYYYVLNAQGDVVRIVDSSRSVVASYTYDPWGKIISSSGTLADINPLRYRGYYYDAETGFYYLQSRYYDPEIGRFINADSYASTDATGLLSTNMFAYCENDPVNKSDPDGEVAHLAIGAVVGAIANVGFSYLNHMIAGESYGLKEAALDALSGAASGALAASGVGLLGQVIGNGLTSGVAYFARADINNQRTTTSGFLVSIAEGMMSGAIGGKGADGAKLSGVYKTAKQMIGNTTSPKKIAMYSAKIVEVKKTIAKGVRGLNLSLMFSNFIGNMRSQLVNLISGKK